MVVELNHKQTSFVTLLGETVDVDEGMVPILSELRRLGITTKFSCQGGPQEEGYVVGDSKMSSRLIRKILKNFKNNKYSIESAQIVHKFLIGYRLYEFCHFRQQGEFQVWQMHYQKNYYDLNCYAVERTYSTTYGRRVTIRWKTQDGDKFLQLLRETR